MDESLRGGGKRNSTVIRWGATKLDHRYIFYSLAAKYSDVRYNCGVMIIVFLMKIGYQIDVEMTTRRRVDVDLTMDFHPNVNTVSLSP